MKLLRRCCVLFATAALVCIFTASASAAYSEDCADELNLLGLFLGGDDGYELDAQPTRVQMAVMLVRLLGLEGDADQYTNAAPFTDVPAWASGYTGILFQNGLISGTSETTFSPGSVCTAEMYATTLLRSLGYSEQDGVFAYGGAVDFALRAGVVEYISWGDEFTRADMAIMSRTALFSPMADGSYDSLLSKLSAEGAVDTQTAAKVLAANTQKLELRDFLAKDITKIMHAGGAVGSKQLTNSLEAVTGSYQKGSYYLEIDFSWTSDGELVCLHDWNTQFFTRYKKSDFPLSLAQFESSKIYGFYTPMSIYTLTDWMKSHPGAYIITDVKSVNLAVLEYIAAEYPELQSLFIPQIYSMDEYRFVRELGYDNIILTLYKMNYSEVMNTSSLVSFSHQNRLLAITFEQALTARWYVSALSGAETRMYVHTVDDAELEAILRSYGVYAVYKNFE